MRCEYNTHNNSEIKKYTPVVQNSLYNVDGNANFSGIKFECHILLLLSLTNRHCLHCRIIIDKLKG
jgi:hypothetical protein